jgi:hypothetical protein
VDCLGIENDAYPETEAGIDPSPSPVHPAGLKPVFVDNRGQKQSSLSDTPVPQDETLKVVWVREQKLAAPNDAHIPQETRKPQITYS